MTQKKADDVKINANTCICSQNAQILCEKLEKV